MSKDLTRLLWWRGNTPCQPLSGILEDWLKRIRSQKQAAEKITRGKKQNNEWIKRKLTLNDREKWQICQLHFLITWSRGIMCGDSNLFYTHKLRKRRKKIQQHLILYSTLIIMPLCFCIHHSLKPGHVNGWQLIRTDTERELWKQCKPKILPLIEPNSWLFPLFSWQSLLHFLKFLFYD